MAFALTGATIFDGKAFHEGKAVIIDGARIADVIDDASTPATLEQRHLGGGTLAPGFVDVQVNGGGGALLNDRPSPEVVRQIAQCHRVFGTVAMLPTAITDAPDVLEKAIAAVQNCDEPGVIGIHIEGPFIDPARKGAHDAQFIRTMTDADVATISHASSGSILVTLAPNRVSPHMIRELVDSGVHVSLGHADAILQDVAAALDAGASAFTHLFNAMSQLTPREPGMVGCALAHKASYCGLIADGHHVHDAALKLAIEVKTPDRIMLITDAMPSAAGGPDQFLLQGRRALRASGRLQLDDGTLAGSDLTMDAAVRYCVDKLGIGLGAALRMASLTPATFLGRENDLGRIRAGHLASLVHLDDDLQVRQVWVEGR
jgi:N-acetylglucosamine-6-phosphate deacetylase